MSYSWTVPLALVGFVPFSLFLFGWLGPLRGVLATFVTGFLFLPVAQYEFSGFPGWERQVAITFSAFLGVLLFDSRRVAQFRPSWLDLPMLCWCVGQMFSSLANDLGYWDGQSQFVAQFLICGLPYFIGRLYVGSVETLSRFVVAYLLGAVAYVPLCMFEIWMSPQLHRMVYGFHAHSFAQTYRLGGWRPTVFLDHGISVGLLMCSAAVAAIWLWRTGSLRRLWGVPISIVALVILVIALACKSTGAIALMLLALGALWLSRIRRSRVPLLLLILLVPVYILARANSFDLGSKLVEIARAVVGERAGSLEWRMHSEEVLAKHALQRPFFGWGAWGRNLVSEYGAGPATPDARWVIYFGVNGYFGLISWLLAVLLPAWLILRRAQSKLLFHPAFAPVVVAVLLEVLFVLDSLLNADHNPAYMLLAGGLAGLAASMRRGVRVNAASQPRLVPVGRPRPGAPAGGTRSGA